MGYHGILGVDALCRDAGAVNVKPMLYLFDTPSPEAEAAAESYLAELSKDPACPLAYESKATQRAHFQEFQMTFVILGGLLCAILGIAIPSGMYRYAAKQSAVERLRKSEG